MLARSVRVCEVRISREKGEGKGRRPLRLRDRFGNGVPLAKRKGNH